MLSVHTSSRRGELSAYPDLYFTPAYGTAATVATEGREWMLLDCYDGAWQMPLITYDFGMSGIDAQSPYGYSGIYAKTTLSSTDQSRAWKSALGFLRDRGVISVFMRHSPIVNQAEIPMAIPIVHDHPTFLIDTRNPDHTWAGLEGRCRTAIRRALASGLTVDITPAKESDLQSGAPFRRLYRETMSRRGALQSYSFSDAYYQCLSQELGNNLLIAKVKDEGGKTTSCALFMRHDSRLHYHLAASSANPGAGSGNLLIWGACNIGRDLGIDAVHLGGGLIPGDSLHRFKRSFGGTVLGYNTSGVIVDSRAYSRLVQHARGDDTLVANHAFFPEYRRSH